MKYNETLQYLYASQPAFHQVGATAYKPGLANTYRLMKHLGNPHTQFHSVHIAGTNGKGSTSHLIAAVLQSAGYKVGLYTSPHLVDFRERIRINGQLIPEEEVVRFVADNQAFLEEVRPSFFETTMALAFAYFAAEKVDIAVIEVGLGGRLDSTNIITPELSVITNIGMDHTEFLGTTLAQIAAEKAGIIKPHIPIVIGETHPETTPIFLQIVQDNQAEITFASSIQCPAIQCQLQGIYQEKNKQTAYCSLQILNKRGWDIPEEAICKGYANVCTLTGLRGRWEILSHSPLTICDTGHNSHGIRYVVEQLNQLMHNHPNSSCHIVFGMVNDKDVDVVLSLLPKQATYYFAQAQTYRAIPAAKLQLLATEHGLQGSAYLTSKKALQAAQNDAHPNDIIFIGGSNYIVGELL